MTLINKFTMCAVTAIMLGSSSISAIAALGEDQMVPPPDDPNKKILSRVEEVYSTGEHYILVTSILSSGTEIREYLTIRGRVFAEGWRGPVQPDMKVMLGAYYPQYMDAINKQVQANPRPRGGGVSVDEPNLHVESGGHMMSFDGRAWVPSLIPPGFSLALIN